jgi:hypothetical protein
VRFKLNWKRSGILLIHAGLILLICGELLTSLFAHESKMIIDVGQTVNYTQDTRECELAIIDPSDADRDLVTVIPQSIVERGGTITDSRLPFAIRVDAFYPNSNPIGPFQLKQMAQKPEARATAGVGTRVAAIRASNAAVFSKARAEPALQAAAPTDEALFEAFRELYEILNAIERLLLRRPSRT